MYDVIWDWKKELDEKGENSEIKIVGAEFDIRITAKDHISCINDIMFIIKRNGWSDVEFAIPISKIEYAKFTKVDEGAFDD